MDVPQAHSLVFEGGDVIFHTSDQRSGVFVLHKHVLAAESPYFRAMLSEEWGRTARVGPAGTLPVFEMDLRLDLQEGFALRVLRVSPGIVFQNECNTNRLRSKLSLQSAQAST
jgi:hypothetical protein